MPITLRGGGAVNAEGCIIYIATGALNPSALSGMLPFVGAAEAGSLRSMGYAGYMAWCFVGSYPLSARWRLGSLRSMGCAAFFVGAGRLEASFPLGRQQSRGIMVHRVNTMKYILTFIENVAE